MLAGGESTLNVGYDTGSGCIEFDKFVKQLYLYVLKKKNYSKWSFTFRA